MKLDELLGAITPETIINVYTDGACSGNPGPGGWGAVIKAENHVVEMAGGEPQTTNNRMEMMAALMVLETIPASYNINIYTDSSYLKDGVTSWMVKWKKNGWRTASKQPVKNQDIWERIDAAIQTHKVSWHWVKGHNGHPENERADTLAVNAVVKQRMKPSAA